MKVLFFQRISMRALSISGLLIGLVTGHFTSGGAIAFAQESATKSTQASKSQTTSPQQGQVNCTDFYIDEAKTGVLTAQEQIEALDDVFYQSVDRYQRCMQEQMEQSNSSASEGSSGASSGGGAGSGSGSSAGSESSSDAEGSDQNSNSKTLSNSDIYPQQPAPEEQPGVPSENNKPVVPEDIPPADNDTVLQRQIREAAMAETDPEKKKKLWDLYRKYKGKQS